MSADAQQPATDMTEETITIGATADGVPDGFDGEAIEFEDVGEDEDHGFTATPNAGAVGDDTEETDSP